MPKELKPKDTVNTKDREHEMHQYFDDNDVWNWNKQKNSKSGVFSDDKDEFATGMVYWLTQLEAREREKDRDLSRVESALILSNLSMIYQDHVVMHGDDVSFGDYDHLKETLLTDVPKTKATDEVDRMWVKMKVFGVKSSEAREKTIGLREGIPFEDIPALYNMLRVERGSEFVEGIVMPEHMAYDITKELVLDESKRIFDHGRFPKAEDVKDFYDRVERVARDWHMVGNSPEVKDDPNDIPSTYGAVDKIYKSYYHTSSSKRTVNFVKSALYASSFQRQPKALDTIKSSDDHQIDEQYDL